MKYFSPREFACKGKDCCGGQSPMSPWFVDKLDRLREDVGFPLVVSSGYRCFIHNQRVSTTGPQGPHTTGQAVDIAVEGERAFLLLDAAFKSGDFTGIGVHQKGSGRFIHLDDLPNETGRPRPRSWSY